MPPKFNCPLKSYQNPIGKYVKLEGCINNKVITDNELFIQKTIEIIE